MYYINNVLYIYIYISYICIYIYIYHMYIYRIYIYISCLYIYICMHAIYIYIYIDVKYPLQINDIKPSHQRSRQRSLQRHQGLRPVGGASADCAEDGPVEGARHPWVARKDFSREIDIRNVLGTCFEHGILGDFLKMGFLGTMMLLHSFLGDFRGI